MPRRRSSRSPAVVYRTARAGLRVTRAQRRRLLELLVSAGEVRACVLEINAWRRARQDRPLVSYQELCRELAASGPGTFGELDTAGARSVLRRWARGAGGTTGAASDWPRHGTAGGSARPSTRPPKPVITWAVTHRVGTLAVGDPRGVLNLDASRRHNQRIRDWRIGHLIAVLKDKAESAGISLQLVGERGTSSTCPACHSRVPKPAGRVLACPACQFTGHRDLTAAANIAARYGGGITPASLLASVTHRRAGAHLPGVAPRDVTRAHHRGACGSPGRHRPARASPTPTGPRVARPSGEEPEVTHPTSRQVH